MFLQYRFITWWRKWRSLFFQTNFWCIVEMMRIADSLLTSHFFVLNKSYGLICRTLKLNSIFINGLYKELYIYYPTQSTSTHSSRITLFHIHVLVFCINLLYRCFSVVYQTNLIVLILDRLSNIYIYYMKSGDFSYHLFK